MRPPISGGAFAHSVFLYEHFYGVLNACSVIQVGVQRSGCDKLSSVAARFRIRDGFKEEVYADCPSEFYLRTSHPPANARNSCIVRKKNRNPPVIEARQQLSNIIGAELSCVKPTAPAELCAAGSK